MTSIEICAGAGGQALGLEMAGFEHLALVENDKHACETLRLNRPNWNVVEGNLEEFDGRPYQGVDLLAGGVPCPPFSHGGMQLGIHDERNLFPEAIRLVGECKPRAVMLENVRGLLDPKFEDYRNHIQSEIESQGYLGSWRLHNASDFGVPQLRPRVIFVAIKSEYAGYFKWPEPHPEAFQTVGETLFDLMSAGGWTGAKSWKKKANKIAPTIVGGSKKHGGPDLGPTRAKKAWAELCVNGMNVMYDPPSKDFKGMPYLTLRMVARLQGFPDSWEFFGKKTHSYRQIGNAFPPPVSKMVGLQIKSCLESDKKIIAA
jgi:DNA (cytosine-5)-methyltransferase 1